MTTHSNAAIATAWLQNCRDAIAHGSESAPAGTTFWAYNELDDLCTSDPPRALDIILAILNKAPEERVRYNLAAGPLEVLLTRSGAVVLSEVQTLAIANDAFLELLAGTWTDGMPKEVRETVAKLVDAGGSGATH